MSRSILHRALSIAALSLLALAGGCETDDTTGGLIPVCVGFIPDQAQDISGEVVSATSDLSDCDIAVIELRVTGVDKLWGISFEIDYPSGTTRIATGSNGLPIVDVSTSVLGTEDELLIHSSEDPLGHVEIGVSRNATYFSAGVDLAALEANPVVLRLGFVRFASAGQGDMSFTAGETSLSFRLPDQPPTFDTGVVSHGGLLFIQ